MSVFRFKQFAVTQLQSAMKVGTDSVLLGSLLQAHPPQRVLDIGTGTGVLALMMAQRFGDAIVDAVEIEEKAFAEAKQNVSQSVFADRVNVVHQSLQTYAGGATVTYDLVVSNPPYYEVEHSFGIAVEDRSFARHTATLPFDELLQSILLLLSDRGNCWMILPKKEAEQVIHKAQELGLSCSVEIAIFPNKYKPYNRIVFCLTRVHSEKRTESFYIQGEAGQYTQAYRETTQPFLLWNK